MYLNEIKEGITIDIFECVNYGWYKKRYEKVGSATVTKIYDKYKSQIEVNGELSSKKFDISSFDIIDDKVYENNKYIQEFIKMDKSEAYKIKSQNNINNNIKYFKDFGINIEEIENKEESGHSYIANFKYGISYKIYDFNLNYNETEEYSKKMFEEKMDNILYFISLIDDNYVSVNDGKFYSKCLDCNKNIEVLNLNNEHINIEERISKFINNYNRYEKYSRCEECKEKIGKLELHEKRIGLSEKMVDKKYKKYKNFIEENALIIVDEDYSFKGEKTTYRRIYCKCGNRIASMSDKTKVAKHLDKMIQHDVKGCEKCEKEKVNKFIKENSLIIENENGNCKIKCSCKKLIKKVVLNNADYNLYNMMLDNIIGCKKCIEELNTVKEEKTINIRIRKPNKILNNKLIESYIAKEGQKKIKQMIVKHRNSYITKLAKEAFKKENEHLYCECCGFNFNKFGLDYAEAHHKYAIAEREFDEETRIEDLIMLCSNCHTLVHGLNITVDELKMKLKEE
jgi:hypothetical protein